MPSLSQLEPGQPAIIKQMGQLDERLQRRLRALGFYEGCPIKVVRASFLGGPLTVEQVDHRQRVALRQADARHLEVV